MPLAARFPVGFGRALNPTKIGGISLGRDPPRRGRWKPPRELADPFQKTPAPAAPAAKIARDKVNCKFKCEIKAREDLQGTGPLKPQAPDKAFPATPRSGFQLRQRNPLGPNETT